MVLYLEFYISIRGLNLTAITNKYHIDISGSSLDFVHPIQTYFFQFRNPYWFGITWRYLKLHQSQDFSLYHT